MHFASPHYLWLSVLLVPMIAYYVWRTLQGGAAIRISSLDGTVRAPRTVRYYLRHLPFVLRAAAFVLLVVALARPQEGEQYSHTSTEGIDIVLSIDVSGSMLARDFKPDRITAAKEVAGAFIADRYGDRIGLVAFAGEAFTQSPLTTDQSTLQTLLARIRNERLLTLQGVAGIFAARSEGDDLVATDPKGHEKRLTMLRSQNPAEGCRSLADCLAPENDWLGCFAVTAGIGLKELCEKLRTDGDDYSAILTKLLADRLTEAFAEAVHSFVRRQMWGYETGPQPAPETILRGGYRGRRMAFGYPAAPDHTLKREVFDLLGVGQTTGMRLTENCMIDPGESLCGLLFADADYFAVGPVDREQAEDYARRRGCTPGELEKLLPNNYRP